MKEQKLDAEEAALKAAYEAGELVSDFSAERAKKIQAIARESAKKKILKCICQPNEAVLGNLSLNLNGFRFNREEANKR